MNKKILITVFIATLLALLCAFMFLKKDNKEKQELEIPQKGVNQEEVIDDSTPVLDDNVNEDSVDSQNVDVNTSIYKPVNENNVKTFSKVIKEDKTTETTSYEEKSIVQEGGVVQEVEDYGVRTNEDGLVEVTREFRMKSPRKYSFVDFGFLEKVVR